MSRNIRVSGMVSMESFKNGEKVLTRLESLDYTVFSKGFRIIGRLYSMHKCQNAWNPLIYKGFKPFLSQVGIRKEKWYFKKTKLLCVFVSIIISIGYDLFYKVGMLKLSRVLTCKKLSCMNITCAVR